MFGERIHQARLLAGMTQKALAEALTRAGYPVTGAAVSKYEKNQSTPPAQFLLLAASILDVPSTYFTHEPQAKVDWLAFRRHSKLPIKQQKAVMVFAEGIAELQVELQTLLHPSAKADLPEAVPVSSFEEAEAAAEKLREYWGLDNRPINNLIQEIEDHTVIVIGWGRYRDKFDGLSGRVDNHYPVIVFNTNYPTDRQRFTLAHELGHLLMDTSKVSAKESERLAQCFASALLVPSERIKYELGNKRSHWDWDEVAILKQKYGLSMIAWVYRAEHLGIISAHYADTLYQQMSAREWRKHEPVEYIVEETPLALKQMCHRAVAEHLMSPDRIRRVYPDWFVEKEPVLPSKRLTVYDLLAMPEEERQRVMNEAFARSADDDNIEILEAFDDLDFEDAPV